MLSSYSLLGQLKQLQPYSQQRFHLYWLVTVGGEVLSDETNDEAAPQSSADAEEQVPVLDDTTLVLSEDAGELLWKGTQADS